MAELIMSKQYAKDLELDGSIQGQAFSFLTKLMKDHRTPGLHIEPIKGSVDPRVRTGRVTQNYRAVMFLLDEENEEPTFLLAGIKKHDVANKLAERIILRYQGKKKTPVVTVLPETRQPTPNPITPTGSGGWASPFASLNRDDVIEGLNLDPQVFDALRSASSEDAMLAVLLEQNGFQQEALFALADGATLTDVIDSLDLAPSADDVIASEGVRAFDQPAAQMDFVRVTNDDELAEVLGGSFASWRIFLHPDQRRYAYKDSFAGPFRLSGGAGTGKTVVALHRARHLAKLNPDARIILTTYTTTLAESLLRSFEELDPDIPLAPGLGDRGVLIVGIDKLAQAALRKAGHDAMATAAPHLAQVDGARIQALPDDADRQTWQRAIHDAGAGLPTHLKSDAFMSSEYRAVILAAGITTRDQYLTVPRQGRVTRLNRAERSAVWAAVENYREQLGHQEAATFAEIAAIAGTALVISRQDGVADHVVIDEAQDLHVGHWRLLRAMVKEGPNDLFICEDSHQRIYGEKVVLGRLDITIRGRSRRLTLNYRTTRENLAYAVRILEGAGVTDIEGEAEETKGYRSVLTGPRPRFVSTDAAKDEVEAIATTLHGWTSAENAEADSFGVLVRDAVTRDRIAKGLAQRGVKTQVIKGPDRPVAGVPQILTMHRAKGLEFRRVILAGLNASAFSTTPRGAANLPAEEREDAAQRERLLLYVAATRARDELVVTWSGTPSAILPDNYRRTD